MLRKDTRSGSDMHAGASQRNLIATGTRINWKLAERKGNGKFAVNGVNEETGNGSI